MYLSIGYFFFLSIDHTCVYVRVMKPTTQNQHKSRQVLSMSWGWKEFLFFFLFLTIVVIIVWILFLRPCNNNGEKNQQHSSAILLKQPSTDGFFSFLRYPKANTEKWGESGEFRFKQQNLQSDIPHTARITNAQTVNAWGVFIDKPQTNPVDADADADADDSLSSAPSTVYVVNNGTSTIQQFSTDKTNTLLATYHVPGNSPTGVVVQSTAHFGGNLATIITCTEIGTICALIPVIDPINLQVVVNNPGATYKGLAWSSTHLYVTNFNSGYVERYDANFTFVDQFTDLDLITIGYTPFNVKIVPHGICGSNSSSSPPTKDSQVIVTFALQSNTRQDDVPGIGHGYIDTFSSNGTFVKRLIDRGHLNSPWGLSLYSVKHQHKKENVLFVGNFGDGVIHAYKLHNGKYLGHLSDCQSMDPLVIDGIWGIEVVQSTNHKEKPNIYFAAGIQQENHGLYGKLRLCHSS